LVSKECDSRKKYTRDQLFNGGTKMLRVIPVGARLQRVPFFKRVNPLPNSLSSALVGVACTLGAMAPPTSKPNTKP
jgi:hypothetical protein